MLISRTDEIRIKSFRLLECFGPNHGSLSFSIVLWDQNYIRNRDIRGYFDHMLLHSICIYVHINMYHTLKLAWHTHHKRTHK